jgi:hypothetical protein
MPKNLIGVIDKPILLSSYLEKILCIQLKLDTQITMHEDLRYSLATEPPSTPW